MHLRVPPWLTIMSKPLMSILAVCLILLVYMGFLLTTNYKNQVALHQSCLKTFKLDMGKRGASIEYFFSERKYDLVHLASSHEISGYFMNKSFGMSENYGLKLSFFLIKKLLKNIILSKLIHGREIYKRFMMVDNNGHCLVDTFGGHIDYHNFFYKKFLSDNQKTPEIFVKKINGKLEIMMAVPCFYKNKLSGELVAILNLSSFAINFINFPHSFSTEGFELITRDGKYLYGNYGKISDFAYKFRFNIPVEKRLTKKTLPGLLSVHEYSKILVAVQPIDNAPLDLIGWIDKNLVLGSFEPWKLFAVTGIIAIIILVSLGIIIRINIENMILQTRFNEAEKQHKLITEKNRQLKSEIIKRYKAEKDLEEQRTLRIRSDRLRSLGEMAAGMAHELNQPLMGVRGMSELILLGINKKDSISLEKIQRHAKIIMEQSDRMVHIIKHVRLFAREAGSIEKSIEDLNEVVNSGMSLLQAQFKSHGIALEISFSPTPVFVFINPFSLEEVILNLLGNARDAVEEKKKISVKLDYTPVVSISTWYSNGDKAMAYLEIKDNGTGISKDISPKIFDPFFTTKASDKGTGLGLSITKSIIEEFNGEITLNSKEGKGSIFTINFPIYIMEKTYKGNKCIEDINN